MRTTMPGSGRVRCCPPAFFFFESASLVGLLAGFLLLALGTAAARAASGELALAWDAVPDERVALYELHYGAQSGLYVSQVDATTTTATVTGLTEAQTYYFAVRACDQDRALCSAFSQEVSATVPPTEVASPPMADFIAGPTTGPAPLTVGFTDQSSGGVTDWLWDFGDGTQSAEQSPSHVYLAPGTYTVSLTVSGPDGSDTRTQTDLVNVAWPPPVAGFSASPSSGWSPLVVTFTDDSSGNITGRLWDFGDGNTSTATDAVHQYDAPGSYTVTLTVTGPGGSDTVIKTDAVVVSEPPPTAGFTADVRSGAAPLDVSFTDLSSGAITSWQWSFGDGGVSVERSPSHTYTQPGVYSVTLTVTGSSGSDTRTETGFIQVAEPAFAWETGDLVIDDVWQRVDFTRTYADPVVIAKPLSMQDRDPAVVRLDGIDTSGFWIRVQEWDYLDGAHKPEEVSYLVVESGTHQLPDGTSVEAGYIETDVTGDFAPVDFLQPFGAAPVVLASVASFIETDAVTARVRNVTETGFEVGMFEQEANAPVHAAEEIGFIAWPQSAGTLEGLRYEVGRTAAEVDHKPYGLTFTTTFAGPPRFFADTQTANDGDPATLRLKNKSETDVQIVIDEEQSRDRDTRRRRDEAVGYIVLEAP